MVSRQAALSESKPHPIPQVTRYLTPQGVNKMKLHHIPLLATASIVLALASSCAVAGDYYLDRHPNMATADALAARAIDRMHDAQNANDYHLGGHAGRAIQLLQQARYEIQASAESASR